MLRRPVSAGKCGVAGRYGFGTRVCPRGVGKGCSALVRIAEAIASLPRRRRIRIRIACVTVAAMLMIGVATFWLPLSRGNFGVVDPGLVYRAAQPGVELTRLVRGYRIASILNLRGGSRDDPWYVAELNVARDQGLEFYDLPMSACRRPMRRELLVLLDLFEHCRYPLLIHCKSGSDRTGLACALYLMSRRGEPPGWAVRGFTLKHGHVPLFGPEHLHEPFREYEAWLKARGLDHSPARFRDWVEHDYQADDLATNIPRLPPGPRTRFESTGG
jgi:Swiss Army Knife protein, DSP-PTPase phosphatase domain